MAKIGLSLIFSCCDLDKDDDNRPGSPSGDGQLPPGQPAPPAPDPRKHGKRGPALYSYEGTREINQLIVGRAITGMSAFV